MASPKGERSYKKTSRPFVVARSALRSLRLLLGDQRPGLPLAAQFHEPGRRVASSLGASRGGAFKLRRDNETSPEFAPLLRFFFFVLFMVLFAFH